MRRIAYTTVLLLLSTSAFAENTVVKYAQKSGFTQCAKTTAEIAEFLIEDHKHASHDFVATNNINTHPLSSLIVKSYSDGNSQISLTVMPRQDGKTCDWSYTETSIYDSPCQIVREKSFSSLKFVDSMADTTLALEKGSLNYYLTPSQDGKSCLVTKREIFLAK